MRVSRAARGLLWWLPIVAVVGVLVGAAPHPAAKARLTDTAYSPWASVPAANVDAQSNFDGSTIHTLNDQLSSVSCVSGDCMAVGTGYTTIDGFFTSQTLAESSSGGKWALSPSVNPSRELGDQLDGVSCVSTSLCMAVGSQGSGPFAGGGATFAEAWNGSAWTAQTTPTLSSNSNLSGVSCPDETTCYAAGYQSGGNGALIEKATLAGPYVNASAGTVVSGEQTSSPNGAYTADWHGGDGTVTVTLHVQGQPDQQIINTDGTIGGFSPDSQSFVTETLNDSGQVNVELYNLGAYGTPIFTADPTVTSSRLVFSPSGRYFMLAYTTPTQTFLDVANAHASDADAANTFTTGGLDAASAPGTDDNSFGSLTYGFGPDDSRFLYGYVASGAQTTSWHWTNLTADAPQQVNSFTMSATSGYAQFSPGGKFLAFVNGTGTGNVTVDLFDSTTGASDGVAGPASSPSPPAINATTTGQVATINGTDHVLTSQTDFSWSPMTVPQPTGIPAPPNVTVGSFEGEGLNSISCVSSDDCVAVGNYGFSGTDNNTHLSGNYEGWLVLHWDGSSWTVVYKATSGKVTQTVPAVSCVAADGTATGDACVITGYSPTSTGLLQLNSTGGWTSWRQVTGPRISGRASYQLAGVSCVSASDCTAMGWNRLGSAGANVGMAAHWDGTNWSLETVPSPNFGSFYVPIGISCWDAGKCTAVGATQGAYAFLGGPSLDTGAAALVLEQGQEASGTASISASTVPYGTQVTYSLNLSGPATPSSGTVAFATGGDRLLCTAPLHDGGASCATSSAPAGKDPIFAFLEYNTGSGPDQPMSGSWQAPNLTVLPPPTTTTPGVEPGSVTVGDSVTYSATVGSFAGTPSGSVTFSIGSLTLCTATLSGGTGSCGSTKAPVGTNQTVKAKYKGNSQFGASSGTTTLTVLPADGAASTTTGVEATPSHTSEGQTVTYSATVSADSGTPTGSVSFTVGSTDLCTGVLSGGTASCRSAAAPAGDDTLTGTYSGDPNYDPSDGTTPLTVDAATTVPRLFVANSGNNTLTSYAASFSGDAAPASTVADDGSGTALNAPGGAVFDGSGNLWVADCGASSITEYTAADLAPAGTPTPAAKLTDDGSGSLACPDALAFDASGDLWVANADSATLTEYTPSQLGDLGTTSDPTAAVTVSDNGDGNLPANGLAFDSSGDLWAANSNGYVVSEYTPGQLAADGAPTPAAQLIGLANGIAFDSSGDLWAGGSGQLDEYTPDQLANLGTVQNPTPVVQVGDDGSGALSVPQALSFDSLGNLWVADAYSSSLLEYDTDQLSASGNPTPVDLIAGDATGLVAPAGLAVEDGAAPGGNASAEPGSVVLGDSVTYSATISGSAGTPTGTVTFSTGGIALCTATLSGGTGSCDSTAAPIGTDDVTAVYSGDSAYAGSILDTSVDVAPPPAEVEVGATPSPAVAGQNVELSVAVSGPGPTPTGTVDFTYDDQELCSTYLDDTGDGSCIATTPPVGDDTITASYSGDPNFAASTGMLDLTSQAPGPSAPSIVVGDLNTSELQSFPLTSSGDALATTTVSDSGSEDLRRPVALTADASGDLWVADASSGEILEYTPDQLAASGAPTPAVVIASNELDIPSSLAFDSSGNLWVLDSEDGNLVEFGQDQLAAGGDDVAPAALLSSNDFSDASALAFDGAGNVWILNGEDDNLLEYTPAQLAAGGNVDPAVTISDGGSGDFEGGAGMTFDSSGNLWVSAWNGIAELTPGQLAAGGSPTPSVSIGDDGSGTLSDPAQLELDSSGNLWVASPGDSAVLEYAPAQLTASGEPTPAKVIVGPTTQLQEPAGLAILGAAGAPPPPPRSTATAVDCVPSTLTVGSPSTCTAAVSDTADGTPTTPGGSVSFESNGTGNFSDDGACTLSAGACQITYTPTAVGSGTHRITASYGGDTTHAPSSNHADLTVGAGTQTLTVSRTGAGTGTVTSSPAGISCGSTCTHAFASGTSVTLTAAAAPGSTFAGWSGACTGTGQCTVSMTAAKSVTATFAVVSETLTVTKNDAVGGDGVVTSSPSGISCGSTCSTSFAYGTSVTLTATAAAGSTFGGWSGACTGTASCTVTMNAAASVTATFAIVIPEPVPKCVVPKVKGKTLAAAKRAIRSANCSLGRIRKAASKKVKKGSVISQSPRPGKKLAAHGKVNLVVSKGR